MSYTAKVYNVMLASPSDVSEERKAAREIILDWNNLHTPQRKIILLPTGWEYNSVPTMGDRPQEIINTQVLKDADLLVGIFWTCVGTPTGEAISGTVEEINKHITSGKPAMLYFSNKSVVPDSIDSIQYEEVKRLKKDYQTKGLTESFDSVEDFQKKFQRHLTLKINTPCFVGYSSETFIVTEVEEPNDLPGVSSVEAKGLLLEAVQDKNGRIDVNDFNGISIKTNNKIFINSTEARTKALWKAVLNDLRALVLIEGTGTGTYYVTERGYKMCEQWQTNL